MGINTGRKRSAQGRRRRIEVSGETRLAAFYELQFRPSARGKRSACYRLETEQAIQWLHEALGREARLRHLNGYNVQRAVDLALLAGVTTRAARRMRFRLAALARCAGFVVPDLGQLETIWRGIRKHKASDDDVVRLDGGRISATLPLRAFVSDYVHRFAEQLAFRQWPARYDFAIARLGVALGRVPMVGDLCPDRINAARVRMFADGVKPDRRRDETARLNRLAQLAVSLGIRNGAAGGLQIGPAPRAGHSPHPEQDDLPPAAEGTVRHYYDAVYRPRVRVRCAETTERDAQSCWRALREHFGRDILLSEQTDDLAADHFGWLSSRGLCNVSVNGHRASWFAVWRYAFKMGLAAAEPRVRKLKVPYQEPDAWTFAEARRIIVAAGCLEAAPICGIPAANYWRALLLVCWWTALRRRSLLSIRVQDVDLETGWLRVYGEGMKNRCGKTFRLGADALDAIKLIDAPRRELLFPWVGDRTGLSKHFDRILGIAQVRGGGRRGLVHFHKMRRTVATHIASTQGVNAASKLLGHGSEEVTLRYIDPSKMAGNDATAFLPSLTQ